MAFDAGHAVSTARDFDTDRLRVRHWAPALSDPERRAQLGRDLTPLLTSEVTARLPADLAFDQDRDDIDRWIDTADGLAEIQTITRVDTGALAGLLLLFGERDEVMIGYFLGPDHWGQGLASDMLAGLVDRLDQGPPKRLFAGTDADNIASQRVLEKAGFTRVLDDSTPDRAAFSRRVGG